MLPDCGEIQPQPLPELLAMRAELRRLAVEVAIIKSRTARARTRRELALDIALWTAIAVLLAVLVVAAVDLIGSLLKATAVCSSVVPALA